MWLISMSHISCLHYCIEFALLTSPWQLNHHAQMKTWFTDHIVIMLLLCYHCYQWTKIKTLLWKIPISKSYSVNKVSFLKQLRAISFAFLFIKAVQCINTWSYRTLIQISLSLSARETHLLLRTGGLDHVVPAGLTEQNTEVEVCRRQKHQMLEGCGRIHLQSRSTEIQI